MSTQRQTVGGNLGYCRIAELYDHLFASSRHCVNFGMPQCFACRREGLRSLDQLYLACYINGVFPPHYQLPAVIV
jgi:hypothetical protein